ncbi:MAG: Gldg family protein [Nitrospiraceae bacterium]|nr:MAG: Gldg family protein [Nitrospiraceae bacterium]
MKKNKHSGKYYKFFLYLIVVLLINVVGVTLFFRVDLTANHVYSLSKTSEDVVSTLSEPLTIKVFFTRNLPAPYNNIERYLHDLLEEYSVSSNRYFNYQFYNVSTEETEQAKQNQVLAENYGIHPVQIQNIEQDEVKFQRAYMGMVIIHGDIIEAIPTISSTDGLEYKITSTIRKANNKISALLRLQDKINVKLFLSSSLQGVGPYMNLSGLPEMPGRIEGIVKKLNEKNYGKLSFSYLDPSISSDYDREAVSYNILTLQWKDFIDRQGKTIKADKGYAGMVVQYGEKYEKIQLLQVFSLPIFGTQYQLADMDELEKTINETVENVININEEIGYLADHGTHSLTVGPQMPGIQQQGESLSNLHTLLTEDYSISPVRMKEQGIPEALSFLIIAGAREPFSDHELYQIDQFIMKGKNLAVFYDAFSEVIPQNQQGSLMGLQQQGYFVPVQTGIEKLLEHYGATVKRSYILDESSFKQRVPQMLGGGERFIYYAPIVKNEKINKNVNFLSNIKGLVMLKSSPVEINEEKIKAEGLKATKLFSSSDRAWEMSERINLNPMFIKPPAADNEYKSMAMAYVLEGSFPSYFADKPLPVRVEQDQVMDEMKEQEQQLAGVNIDYIESADTTIRKGRPGKIFLIGTLDILKNSVIDEEANHPNSQFVLNVIDYMNDRDDNAVMRTKTQRFNPLKDITPGTRAFIKAANIAGLPVLVIIAGLVVWFRRASRKRFIQQLFIK